MGDHATAERLLEGERSVAPTRDDPDAPTAVRTV